VVERSVGFRRGVRRDCKVPRGDEGLGPCGLEFYIHRG
jgi:hypothetical protein